MPRQGGYIGGDESEDEELWRGSGGSGGSNAWNYLPWSTSSEASLNQAQAPPKPLSQSSNNNSTSSVPHDQSQDTTASALISTLEPGERSTRRTVGGRDLTYVLNIIQQPERARACGTNISLRKSRRPIDPPPVVSLHIYEGNDESKSDITFAYETTFFLFATLRIAHSYEVSPAPHLSHPKPVLVGCLVSNGTYLAQPKGAIYFAFPDLSVVNEGRYNLCFNLYERISNSEDQDVTLPLDVRVLEQDHPEEFCWRLDVSSELVAVFSAKSYPGMKKSTFMTRVLNDSGIRLPLRKEPRTLLRKRDPNLTPSRPGEAQLHLEGGSHASHPLLSSDTALKISTSLNKFGPSQMPDSALSNQLHAIDSHLLGLSAGLIKKSRVSEAAKWPLADKSPAFSPLNMESSITSEHPKLSIYR
jgi:hypothetical protein